MGETPFDEKMNRHGWIAAQWIAGLTAGVVALSWGVNKLGTQRHLVLVGIFSAAALLLAETAVLYRRTKRLRERLEELDRKISSLEKEGPTAADQLKQERNDLEGQRGSLKVWRIRFLRAGAVLLLTSLGFIQSLFCCPSPSPSDGSSATQISEQVTKTVLDCLAGLLKPPPAPPQAGPPSTATARLDPGLEAALRQHLQATPPPAAVPRGVILALIALAVAVAIAAVWLAVSKKPEATPLTIAIGTLTATSAAIEKLIGKGPIPPVANIPWWVFAMAFLLLGVGIVLVLAGAWRLFKLLARDHGLVGTPGVVLDPEVAKGKEVARGSLLGAALLVFGFSVILLALVPPLLLHGEAVNSQACPKCPTQEPLKAPKIAVIPLGSIDALGDGRRPEDKIIGLQKIERVTSDLQRNKAQPGDILLLLGSADCIATKPKSMGGLWNDNAELANARAQWVNDGLQGQDAAKGLKIENLPLPQHARCGLARNVRAVYPFLIRGEGN